MHTNRLGLDICILHMRTKNRLGLDVCILRMIVHKKIRFVYLYFAHAHKRLGLYICILHMRTKNRLGLYICILRMCTIDWVWTFVFCACVQKEKRPMSKLFIVLRGVMHTAESKFLNFVIK